MGPEVPSWQIIQKNDGDEDSVIRSRAEAQEVTDNRAEGYVYSSVIEHLPSMCKALCLILRRGKRGEGKGEKRRKKKGKRKGREEKGKEREGRKGEGKGEMERRGKVGKGGERGKERKMTG
jgi:hypothetical protein